MDHQEEQAQELEILTSIYTEEEFERFKLLESYVDEQKYLQQNTKYESLLTQINRTLVTNKLIQPSNLSTILTTCDSPFNVP